MAIPSWIPSLALATFGIGSYICLMIAEAKKPYQSTIPVKEVNGFYVCEYPSDPSVALASLAVAFIFLTAVIANVFAGVPAVYGTFKIFARHHVIGVFVWNFLAWASTIVPIIILSYAAWQQATHHRNSTQQINGPTGELADPAHDKYAEYYQVAWNPNGILCPTVKTGILGGMGLVTLGSTLLWLGFLNMGKFAYELTEIVENGGSVEDYRGPLDKPVEKPVGEPTGVVA